MNKILKLIISLLIPQLAGAIGSLFTVSQIPSWYATIIKPSFNPPNWIFGPVWTTLFLLMGYSFYLVWNKKKSEKAMKIFGIQLVLNVLWSIVFFGAHSPLWAFVIVIALWIAILMTIMKFYKLSRTAAYLMIPYILWVSFAAVLNLSIVLLN